MAFPHKFGKLPPKPHPLTLKLGDFLAATPYILPSPEQKRGWEYAVPDSTWSDSMLGNDEVGDCVEAAVLHYIMSATANTGNPVTFTKDQAISLYSAVTGYNPSDPNTDQGTAWTDMLAYWQKNGVYGHQILAWASVDYTNNITLAQAVDIFGGLLVGTAVTDVMEQEFEDNEPWNAPLGTNIVGGHGIPLLGYGRFGRTCITWARRQQMDLNVAPEMFDESYVVITPDWLQQANLQTPLGMNMSYLNQAIAAIQSNAARSR
jgi:hypothetical protein